MDDVDQLMAEFKTRQTRCDSLEEIELTHPPVATVATDDRMRATHQIWTYLCALTPARGEWPGSPTT